MHPILRQVGIIFGVIIVLVVLWCWQMMALPADIPRINYQDATFKTGDMILFHAYDNINPIYIGSYWGHVGIVFIDPDDATRRPMFFEATRINENENCEEHNKSGIVMCDLQTRLEKYKGIVVHRPLDKTIDINVNRSFYEFIRFAKQNMFYNNDVVGNGARKLFGEPLNMGTNCGEMTLLCLIKLGLLPQDTLKKKLAHHLRYVIGLTELEHNHYNDRQRLIFNRF